jgi:hypothetical protein
MPHCSDACTSIAHACLDLCGCHVCDSCCKDAFCCCAYWKFCSLLTRRYAPLLCASSAESFCFAPVLWSAPHLRQPTRRNHCTRGNHWLRGLSGCVALPFTLYCWLRPASSSSPKQATVPVSIYLAHWSILGSADGMFLGECAGTLPQPSCEEYPSGLQPLPPPWQAHFFTGGHTDMHWQWCSSICNVTLDLLTPLQLLH